MDSLNYITLNLHLQRVGALAASLADVDSSSLYERAMFAGKLNGLNRTGLA